MNSDTDLTPADLAAVEPMGPAHAADAAGVPGVDDIDLARTDYGGVDIDDDALDEEDTPSELPDDRFIDRELSWLGFNRRVLALAQDPGIPLLERVRFLAIFASNLDEFFMVRVAGLKRRLATGLAVRAASGMQPREVLAAIATEAHELVEAHSRCFTDDIRPKLSAEGIDVVPWEALTPEECEPLHTLFAERILPVLTPLAVDPAHPFPYISGLSLNLAVITESPGTGKEHFARVKVPPLLPRLIAVGPQRFVPLEDVIREHLPLLFRGMHIVRAHSFRVTRNEDVEVEEDDTENLLQALERELVRRRFGPPVRLEVEESIDPHVLDLLVRELEVSEADVYRLPAPLDLTGLGAIADLDRAELRYPPFVPSRHPALAEVESAKPADIFAAISAGEVLLHHPYDSFSTSVQAFLEQAAADPHVLAIKQTLYRTSGDSPIVDALVDAAEAGKQVLVLVEIKARFDEKANIKWARTLEEAGCHVVYGLIGLKTHAKACLVVRDEPDGLRRYAHIGTGNYNPKTARMYEDLGLLTADPAIGEDLSALFNALSGYSRETHYRRLLVAPHSLRAGLLSRIAEQVEAHRDGRGGYIGFKMNSLTDEAIVDALYRASQAGVPVDLCIRGICALRPGVPGLSETIRVRSVLGRFLEHSRIFLFGRGESSVALIGSADMMHRNLDRRIEALVRIENRRIVGELTDMLNRAMSEDTASWWLDADRTWARHDRRADGTPARDLQTVTMRRAHRRSAGD